MGDVLLFSPHMSAQVRRRIQGALSFKLSNFVNVQLVKPLLDLTLFSTAKLVE